QGGGSCNLVEASGELGTDGGEEMQVPGQPASGMVGTSPDGSGTGANPSPEASSSSQSGVSSTNPNTGAGSVSGTGDSSAAASGNTSGTSQSGNRAAQVFQVTDVTKLADPCAAQGVT